MEEYLNRLSAYFLRKLCFAVFDRKELDAAIVILGELGTEEDRALLETYAASTDERIRRIARNALEKLESD